MFMQESAQMLIRKVVAKWAKKFVIIFASRPKYEILKNMKDSIILIFHNIESQCYETLVQYNFA
jgi:hypothetical protein